jgi:hypothetical protein
LWKFFLHWNDKFGLELMVAVVNCLESSALKIMDNVSLFSSPDSRENPFFIRFFSGKKRLKRIAGNSSK